MGACACLAGRPPVASKDAQCAVLVARREREDEQAAAATGKAPRPLHTPEPSPRLRKYCRMASTAGRFSPCCTNFSAQRAEVGGWARQGGGARPRRGRRRWRGGLVSSMLAPVESSAAMSCPPCPAHLACHIIIHRRQQRRVALLLLRHCGVRPVRQMMQGGGGQLSTQRAPRRAGAPRTPVVQRSKAATAAGGGNQKLRPGTQCHSSMRGFRTLILPGSPSPTPHHRVPPPTGDLGLQVRTHVWNVHAAAHNVHPATDSQGSRGYGILRVPAKGTVMSACTA